MFFDRYVPPQMRAASAGAAGGKGLVPAGAPGDQDKALFADGTWRSLNGTFKGGVAYGSLPTTSTAAGDWYYITSPGTIYTKTWAVGDKAVYTGTPSSWVQIATQAPYAYNAPTAIAAAGNTNLALGAGQSARVEKITVNAGSAAYTHTLTLQNTNAVAGTEIQGHVAVAASTNPLVEIRDLTSGGTLLGVIVGDTAARVWSFDARFDGTNWFLTCINKHRAASIDELNAFGNSRGPAQGLVFSGAGRARGVLPSALGNAWTVPATFDVYTPVSTAGIWSFTGAVGGDGYPYILHARLTSSGSLDIWLFGSSGSNWRKASIAGFCTAYAGKRVHVALAQSGGVLTIYVNGASTAYSEASGGDNPTWNTPLTGTYYTLGDTGADTAYFTGFISTTGPLNYCATAAEVAGLYERRTNKPGETGCLFAPQLDQIGSGTRWFDVSGNGVVFTLHTSVGWAVPSIGRIALVRNSGGESVEISGTLAEADVAAHAFADATAINSSGTGAYASYDAYPNMTGALNHYSHLVAYQSRLRYAGSGDGHVQLLASFTSSPANNASGAKGIDSLRHFFAADVAGAGVTDAQYGFYVDPLTAALLNWAFYAAGTTPSYFGGQVTLGTVAEHADNAAALTAGKTAGMIYRTGDTLKVVH